MTVTTERRLNPYVGPRSFQTGETLYGRDREARRLLNLLIAERVVLLYSPSGAGKTSLVQAALIPQLRAEGFAVLPLIRVSQERPPDSLLDTTEPASADQPSANGDQAPARPAAPNRYVLSALLSLEEDLLSEQQLPVAQLARMSLAAYLERREAMLEGSDGTVLILDQFEEILTIDPTDLEAKQAFFAQLGTALRDRRRWALFAMREDYLAPLDPFLRLIPTRLNTTFRLDLLETGAARQAMQQPAQAAGVEFEEAAALALVDDLRRVRVQRYDGTTEEQLGPYVEPVQLQVVCHRLWAQLPDDDMSIGVDDVAAVGDVDRALTAYYADRVAAIAEATGVSERAIRDWCDQQLITEQGIRGQVLQGTTQSGGLPNAAIRPLIDAHLVRSEKRRGATWYELAHDRLIEPVRKDNAAWRESHLSALQQQALLWENQDRPAGLVLGGQALTEAEAWAAAHTDAMTDTERDFLAACLIARADARRERRNNRLIRVLALVAVIVSVIAVWQAIAASQARSLAERQEYLAIIRQLAAQGSEIRERTPQRALLLAVEALRSAQRIETDVPAAQQTLHDTLATVGGIPLRSTSGQTTIAAFGPNGDTLAIGGSDGTLKVWTMASMQAAPRVLSGHTSSITAMAFSPDGRTLATSSADGTARLWSIEDPAATPRVLDHAGNIVTSVAFSPDGRTLATLSADGAARLWSIDDPTSAPRVLKDNAGIEVLAFSPDGGTLATAGLDDQIRLWNVDNPAAPPRTFEHPGGGITALLFSPDGQHLVVGGPDDMLIWSLADRAPPPLGVSGPAELLSFTPDGDYLISASARSPARLWPTSDLLAQAESPEAEGPQAGGHQAEGPGKGIEPIVLHSVEPDTTALAFSRDGQYLVTGGRGGAAYIWTMDDLLLQAESPTEVAEPAVLRGHEGEITSVAFNPDGRALVTTSMDGTARLWDVESPAAEPIILRGQSAITALAISPDGQYLAAGGQTGTPRRWALADLAAPSRSFGDEPITTTTVLAFSPNGTYLATGHIDGSPRLWTVADRSAAPRMFSDQPITTTTALAFSPDGTYLATGHANGSAYLWTVADPAAAPHTLGQQLTPITTLAFSPNGTYLAIGHDDGSVQLWTVANPAASPRLLEGHTGVIRSMAFSPDGQTLITGSFDGTAREWKVEGRSTPRILSEQDAPVTAVAFSPDGKNLAIGDEHGNVRLWPAADLAKTPTVLNANIGAIRSLAFSPDGSTLVAGGTDDSASLWAVADPGADPTVLDGKGDEIWAILFSPDGRRLITGSQDGTAQVWYANEDNAIEMACRMAGRNLSWQEWQQFMGDTPYRKTCTDLPIHPGLIDTASNYVQAGNIAAALDISNRVIELNAAAEISPLSWNKLCWHGSLLGFATEVLNACEQAVTLAPDNADYRDSRGLARARTGNYAGAIEDFTFAIEKMQSGANDQAFIQKRTAWLAALKAGQNPFDEATLEQLQDEEITTEP